MSTPDSSTQPDPLASHAVDPIQDRQRRFSLLSRDDSLKGPAIVLAVGVVLQLVAGYGLNRGAGVAQVALSTALALPINLIGQFVIAAVLGTGLGSFRTALARLTAMIVLLQGLGWLVKLGHETTGSLDLLIGGGALVGVIGFALLMDAFNLSIFETIVSLFILAATNTGANALLDWLRESGVIQLTRLSDSIGVDGLELVQQVSSLPLS